MITRRTRVQLLVFVIITLFGVTYVGARYARLDRFIRSDSYTVVGHFAQSGGIFTGGQVTYRGVGVGQVTNMDVSETGVDVYMRIQNDYDQIPSDTLAVVGNGSAVGEQYVELQPNTDAKPYLKDESEIPVGDTRTPIATEKLLADTVTTVGSIDRSALRTTVSELGKAFGGTGPDLQRLIDTGNSFIAAADDNFDTTRALINDSNVVLRTQIDKESAIRTFSKNLARFSTTLAGADPDLRRLIDTGSLATNQLRALIEENRVDLGELVSELITTGEIVNRHLPGIRQTLVVYPYVVAGGFTVVAKTPETGLYDAHFGAILTDHPLCDNGYQSTDKRVPTDLGDRPMNYEARCAEPPTMSNPRGVQNAPGAGGVVIARNANRAPVLATYDTDTGKLHWGSKIPAGLAPNTTSAPASLGQDSWKWLFLHPLVGSKG